MVISGSGLWLLLRAARYFKHRLSGSGCSGTWLNLGRSASLNGLQSVRTQMRLVYRYVSMSNLIGLFLGKAI